jgi:hypothetical protein
LIINQLLIKGVCDEQEVESDCIVYSDRSTCPGFGNDTSFLHAQDNTGTNQTTVKEKPDGLVVDWLNDFEECEDWRAEATCPLGEKR